MQDAPCKELSTILDMIDVALSTMAAIRVEEKGFASYVVSAVVKHPRAWRRKKVILRIHGEPTIRALGLATQHARDEDTIIECPPKWSSPSVGPDGQGALWTGEALPHLSSGQGEPGNHNRIAVAAVAGPTMCVGSEP